MSKIVMLNPRDNVAICRSDLKTGTVLFDYANLEVRQDIPQFHKIAVTDINRGDYVYKYAQVIGVAITDISAGDHVHVHNIGMIESAGENPVAEQDVEWSPPDWEGPKHFLGFPRGNGKFGTRNYVAILTTVNCSASVSKALERHFNSEFIKANFPNVDGVVAFTHGTGCGMSKGEGYEILNRLLAGLACHPNISGCLIIGLGCEVLQIDDFIKRYSSQLSDQIAYLSIQQEGGVANTVARGKELLHSILSDANTLKREPCPLSGLSVALQCGGSDALSGITANPALGYGVDLLVGQGGTGILSETPEIYGAEHLLTSRAVSDEVAKKLLDRIDWWLEYTSKNGAQLNNNPSPGNKAGGLTTILEKSLGAQAKGGTSPLCDIYFYAEQINKKGFVFMDSPGYDPVSVTGQIAAGANVVVFTTGRGSVFGSVPSPSIKLATNTPMFNRMTDDMDYNCGRILDGDIDIASAGNDILNLIIAIASGDKSKSESQELGYLEFTPWQIGAVV